MKVLLFARARDLAGCDSINLDVPTPATIGELRLRLMREYPKLAGLVEKSAFAVDSQFSDDQTEIPKGAEVALLPPVSGG